MNMNIMNKNMNHIENMENLENVENYKKKFEYSSKNVLENFLNLIKIYEKNIFKNEGFEFYKKEKSTNGNREKSNDSFLDIFYFRGINALMVIYMSILNRTNNLELAYFHCEKSIYYYNEFFSQITNKNNLINVSCSDAIMFLYKKTIYRLVRFNSNNNINKQKTFRQISICLKIIISMLKSNVSSIGEVNSEIPSLIAKSYEELEEILNKYL